MRQLLVVGLLLSLGLWSGCEALAPAPAARSSSDALWNEPRSRPQLLSGVLFRSEGDAERAARDFLASRAAEFHLDGAGSSLTLGTTRTGLAGTYLRFAQQQAVAGETLPVFDAEVIVLVQDDGKQRVVRAVNLEHQDDAWRVQPEGDLGAGPALTAARLAVKVDGPLSAEPTLTRGVYVGQAGTPRLAWRVTLALEEASPPHDWSVFIDAATGAELGRRDGVHFQATVTGSGYVFDMNAVASTNDLTLVDGNNATTAALDAARFLVPLPRLDGSGFLRGTYADVGTRTTNARAQSMTNEFLFTRADLGFEQANTYYHLDRTQQRVQALGFTNVNNRVQAATVDAQTADNSFYTAGSKRLSFGTGGVDDAEDGDIVTHEYGHSIQDNQVPGFGGGDEGAIGEGFGDYLAASFSLSLAPDAGHRQLSDPACIGDWDGTSYATTTPKCLRRVDGTKHYPEAEANEVHDDGEMWSGALWKLRATLGPDLTDTLVLEAHFIMGNNSSFFTASQAMITADAMLNAGANEAVVRRTMIHQGLSRLITAPAPAGPVISLPVSIGPQRDAAGNYRSSTDEVRTVTVPGAAGLLLHFVRLDLETSNQCLAQHCDNVYLTNAAGDLFQVLGGAQQNVTSVAVPGDTVNVRLVSDNSQVRFGYQIDRVDVLGAPDDAGVLFDGGVDLFDAGLPPVFDAGVRDAGMRDAGGVPPPFDAGPSPSFDAGPVPPLPTDAGTTDAGTSTGTRTIGALGTQQLKPVLNRGCGCGATSGAEGFGLLALLGAWRRRRARG